VDITMPQLGETVTEGTITRWLKHVGDRVNTDEPLFEVSTDKVDSEVPAPAAGYLSEIRVNEGETVSVGAVLAVINDAAAPTPAPSSPAPTPPPAPPAPHEAPTAPVPVAAPPSEPDRFAASEPLPAPPSPIVSPPRRSAPTAPELTSPIVRRLVAEHGLDPAQVRGTGEGGRITRKDVLAAAGGQPSPPAPALPARDVTPSVPAAPSSAPPSPPEPAPRPLATPTAASPPAAIPRATEPAPAVIETPSPAPPTRAPSPPAQAPTAPQSATDTPNDTIEPFSNIRRRTAEHMLRSKSTSAHVYTSVEVDYERIARVRSQHQQEWKDREGFPLTYLPFVARAFGDTVEQFPRVNASVGDDALVLHRGVHLGIAVDLDFQGLVAPVLRDADGKRLRLLAREIRDLAERARKKELFPDEVVGATFTITNPGPFGTFMTLPIISQPQVAILSTDSVAKRPVVVAGPDGADVIAVRHTGILALTWDHRAFDGAYAAAFLRALKQDLEQRDWEAELS
jgi:pyruvate dehydrogenase E2 component (dihydrolipoamide acetyltransferase)